MGRIIIVDDNLDGISPFIPKDIQLHVLPFRSSEEFINAITTFDVTLEPDDIVLLDHDFEGDYLDGGHITQLIKEMYPDFFDSRRVFGISAGDQPYLRLSSRERPMYGLELGCDLCWSRKFWYEISSQIGLHDLIEEPTLEIA